MCWGLDIRMCEPVMGRYIHWPGYERTYQTGTKYQPQTNTCLVGTWGNTSLILGLYWSQYQVHSIYTCHIPAPKISLRTNLIPGNVQKLIPAWHSYEHYEPNKQRWVLLAFAYQGKDIIVFRFIIEYSSLNHFGPSVIIIKGLFCMRIFERW
jgi:hypothetical protein